MYPDKGRCVGELLVCDCDVAIRQVLLYKFRTREYCCHICCSSFAGLAAHNKYQ
jgi:hypothetical protein